MVLSSLMHLQVRRIRVVEIHVDVVKVVLVLGLLLELGELVQSELDGLPMMKTGIMPIAPKPWNWPNSGARPAIT